MTRWTPPRVARFVAALLAGLALLTATGYVAVRETTGRWFEHDLELRSRLAVTAASQGLVGDWTADRRALTATLDDITRDERIMGAAACTMDGATVARTAGYPLEFPCGAALLAMREGGGRSEWSGTRGLPSGRVHVSALTVGEPPDVGGVIVLVHDLRFLERRDATARNLLLAAFFVLALGASLVTLLAARFAWRSGRLACAARSAAIRRRSSSRSCATSASWSTASPGRRARWTARDPGRRSACARS